ncbi:MAG TPA: hypothetical protein VLF67_01865 [Candidatus Saccharimonas sp.]|nr:hypothetical protein [Candidatus Saccharimonas sp.]
MSYRREPTPIKPGGGHVGPSRPERAGALGIEDMEPGRAVLAHCHLGYVTRLVIVTRPSQVDGTWYRKIRDPDGNISLRNLGDMGVAPYAVTGYWHQLHYATAAE